MSAPKQVMPDHRRIARMHQPRAAFRAHLLPYQTFEEVRAACVAVGSADMNKGFNNAR
ncbi:hypothetical protein [Pseudoxanthomonas sacheonensis]|uniref:Uncharacterized protein n=1 Tax=Pseudoxanthomonas sacheonensis TaxID=443615 RepID=A0ABU1RQZ0_9GAMM|nr:hypothetical protein [Pseudoxanthomonas sacheonensis]MDR6841198.1 hypothetical protein [Pseudoxanthomonas sacheonensis]